MKNLCGTLFILMLIHSFHLNAQSCEGPALFFEDFNSGIIPSDWTIFNLDTNTLYQTSSAKGYTGQWQPYNHFGRKCVTNCSRFNNSAASPDDYLITPVVHLGAAPLCLSWKSARAYDDPSFGDEMYDVLISTTGATVAGLQANSPLISVSDGSSQWKDMSVDLSAYAGMDVNIGFWHYTLGNGYALSLDDIRMSQPVAIDAKISDVSLTDVIAPGANVAISGTLYNGGLSAITSATLHWSVNGGTVNSYPVNGVNILPQTNYGFTFPSTWNATATGTFTLRVWADTINGTSDQYHANDTLVRYIFVSTHPRKLLEEEFTEASCPPCGSQNPSYDQLLSQNRLAGKMTMIKYHVGWPGYDPMFNLNPNEATDRVIAYGITGAPSGLNDGTLYEYCAGFGTGSPACLVQQTIDSSSLIPSVFDISITTSKTSNNYNVSYSIKAVSDFPLTSLIVYSAVLEDTISYISPPGTNGETNFPQVMRKMLPDVDGVALPSLAAGQSFTQSFSIPILPDYNENELRAIVFVQDDATKNVYQSEMTDQEIVAAVKDISIADAILKIYPNPLTSSSILQLNTQVNNAEVVIYDVLGKEMMRRTMDGNRMEIERGCSESGVYFVRVSSEERQWVQKIVIE